MQSVSRGEQSALIDSILKESRMEISKDVGDVVDGIKQVLNMQNLSTEHLIKRKKIMYKKFPKSDTIIVKMPARDPKRKKIKDIVKQLRTRNNISVEFTN